MTEPQRTLRDRLWVVLLAAAWLAAGPAAAEPAPPDSGMVNARDYGAKGNGHDDDTEALLHAIAASGGDTGPTFWHDRPVYLPNGTYLVSAPLLKRYADGRFGSGLILVGESESGTVLRLADHAAGYGDAAHPRAVVFTTSKLLSGDPTGGGKDYRGKGEGNDAFMNSVEDLTIDVGAGNPGAVAIDYLANNAGAVRRVTLRSTDAGAVGLSMTRKWPGPCLIQDVTVQGFGVGIDVAETEYGVTLDRVRLSGQGVAGLRNRDNMVSAHALRIEGKASAIVNAGAKGLIVVQDGVLNHAGAEPAINNAGTIVARGMRGVLLPGAPPARADGLSGVLTGASWTETAEARWAIAPQDAPTPPAIPVGRWANAARFGASADPASDSTVALQAALNSGAEVVYLPHGTYTVSNSLTVPAGVRRILGFGSTLHITPKRQPSFARDGGLLRVLDGGDSLSIERLALDNSYQGDQVGIEVAGDRPVLLRDTISAGVDMVARRAGGGRVFLENVCCGRLKLAGPQPVFARQLNLEAGGPLIDNAGAPLWVLGLKTEGGIAVLNNHDGARTDLMGGLIYAVRPTKGDEFVFHNDGGQLRAAFVEESLQSNSRYAHYLTGPVTIEPDRFPPRGYGRIVPDLTAGP